MLIKPLVDTLKAQDYFKEIKFSKDIPTLDDFKKGEIALPVCYLLPVKDTGQGISTDARPKQAIGFQYSFCIITAAGDEDCEQEPPMTEAKEKMLEALLGFSITPQYTNMAFSMGQILDKNSKIEIWTLGYETERTYRKQ